MALQEGVEVVHMVEVHDSFIHVGWSAVHDDLAPHCFDSFVIAFWIGEVLGDVLDFVALLFLLQLPVILEIHLDQGLENVHCIKIHCSSILLHPFCRVDVEHLHT